jgi:hypothetical protein
VTIAEDSGAILSIRRNFAEEDDKRRKIQYFVHYKFLPGFGFYGLGLIHTIGGLSRTATAALRQLIDAGTLSNLLRGSRPAASVFVMTASLCSPASSVMLTAPAARSVMA